MKTVKLLLGAIACWSLTFSVLAVDDGAKARLNAYQTVEKITEGLVQIISEHKNISEENPEPLFAALDNLLSQRVDFDFIAYNVMGPYRQQATASQREEFAKTFRRDLIETYGRGLFVYSDQEIVLLPGNEEDESKRRATVYQEVRGNGKTLPLQYTLGLNKEGQWKVTNLVMNGINLGKTFRNQFLQRVQEFNGDISKVIASWSVKSANLEVGAE